MPEKVLVIDDDAAIRREISKTLENLGYVVALGCDGQEALGKVRDERPDLVLMDVEMPGMGGREVCRIIKANKNFKFVPIILMTAREDLQLKIEGLELGADDYLVKPLNQLELGARVKSMLRMRALQNDLLQANDRLREINERLQELSMTDPLMGIYNRLFFHKRISYEFQRASRYGVQLSLLMLDLDHFKRINDSHGHQFGDFVLKKTAMVIAESVRGVDILARYGGEELVIACPETDGTQSKILAERLRSLVEKTIYEFEGIKERITTSIGIAIFPFNGIRDVESLLRAADKALYLAKESGRNCIRCDFEP